MGGARRPPHFPHGSRGVRLSVHSLPRYHGETLSVPRLPRYHGETPSVHSLPGYHGVTASVPSLPGYHGVTRSVPSPPGYHGATRSVPSRLQLADLDGDVGRRNQSLAHQHGVGSGRGHASDLIAREES